MYNKTLLLLLYHKTSFKFSSHVNNEIWIINYIYRLDGKRDEVDCASASTAGSTEPPSGTNTARIVQNTGMIIS